MSGRTIRVDGDVGTAIEAERLRLEHREHAAAQVERRPPRQVTANDALRSLLGVPARR